MRFENPNFSSASNHKEPSEGSKLESYNKAHGLTDFDAASIHHLAESFATGRGRALDANLLYEYFIGALSGVREVDLEEYTQDFESVVLRAWNEWKNNLQYVPFDNLPGDEGRKSLLNKIAKTRDLTSLDEWRSLVEDDYINSLSPFSYQGGARLEGDRQVSGFVYFDESAVGGYVKNSPKSETRYYLNPVPESSAKAVAILRQKFAERKIVLSGKCIDYSHPNLSSGNRNDSLLIYAEDKDTDQIHEILHEIYDENPEWFAGRFIPLFTESIVEGISKGDGLTEKQREIASSFSQLRAILIECAVVELVRKYLTENDGIKVGEETLQQLFGRKLVQSGLFEAHQVSGAFVELSSFDTYKAQRSLKTLNNNGTARLYRLLSSLAPLLISALPVDDFKEKLSDILDRLAPEYDIDPRNFAKNLSNEPKNG